MLRIIHVYPRKEDVEEVAMYMKLKYRFIQNVTEVIVLKIPITDKYMYDPLIEKAY